MDEQPTRQPIPLWLDCDTGHDDALAILLAGRDPSINLLGISTIYGNASLVHTTYNSRAILKAIKREDVPVYIGASKPFCRVTVAAADIHVSCVSHHYLQAVTNAYRENPGLTGRLAYQSLMCLRERTW